jgi:Ca2+-binding RTX toxin-like protein
LTPEVYNNDNEVQLEVQETQAVNSAPTISTIGNVSKSESLSVGSTIATASASDADGDSLTYSLTVDQSGKLSIDQNGAITLASAFDDVASDTNYNVTVRATDGTDDAKADFVLTVTADGSITIHENVLDFEDVHTSNDGGEIAYKQNVGYYQMDLGQGDTTNQARIINNTGHTATNLTNVTTSDLSNIDILYVHNGDNGTWGAEWRSGTGQSSDNAASSSSSAIWTWVNDGGILLIQDRHVTNANAMLLGESATITRDVDATNDDTDFRTELNDTLIYNGAAGTLTNNTLDGGTHTEHGHITNLGTGEVGIGHRGSGNPGPNGESYNNAFAYKYGSGLVYYDTYPMDLWDGFGVNDNYTANSQLRTGGSQVYNENLIQWAASLYYDGASQINGTSGAETILGTMGDDVIFGDYGSDILWGGQGADTFLYTNSNQGSGTIDDIQDFDSSEDSIDISAITSGASVSRTLTNNTQFKLDIDNDGTYDMQFNLVGYTGTADDVTVVT